MESISVIGAGAWGTALAQVIASKGNNVTLWTRYDTHAAEINATHENKQYLAGIPLSNNITATDDFETALENNILLMVTPAQVMRSALEQMKPFIKDEHKLVLCSKGIEIETGQLMSDVAQNVLPETQIAVLSGPNFAHEIAQGKPAATTLGCNNEEIAQTLQKAVAGPTFRPYISHDIIGVQIGGALKNVIAIACGIAYGLDMGESARASLVTRGLAEIARLGVAMGAQQETFLGLSGVGDMMLTCSSHSSRNFSFGFALGKGADCSGATENSQGIAEGVHTAKACVQLAKDHDVEMPICNAIYQCIQAGHLLDNTISELLKRPLGHEQ